MSSTAAVSKQQSAAVTGMVAGISFLLFLALMGSVLMFMIFLPSGPVNALTMLSMLSLGVSITNLAITEKMGHHR